MSNLAIFPLSKNEALGALRAAAWTETPERIYEPAIVHEGEQLYRDVTPPARQIVHCFAGGLGADWDLANAEAEVEGADEVCWRPAFIGHNLAVRTGERVRVFDVPAPEAIQAAWRVAR